MTDNQKKKIMKAITNKEYKELLCGINNYCLIEKGDKQEGLFPQDWYLALNNGVYAFATAGADELAENLLIKTIMELLKGNSEEVWIGYSVCWIQYVLELQGKSPIKIINAKFLEHIRPYISRAKEELSANHKWIGKNYKEGLWEDIKISNKNLLEKYGVTIL